MTNWCYKWHSNLKVCAKKIGTLCKIPWFFPEYSFDCWFFAGIVLTNLEGLSQVGFGCENEELSHRKWRGDFFRFAKNVILRHEKYISVIPNILRVKMYKLLSHRVKSPGMRRVNSNEIDKISSTVTSSILYVTFSYFFSFVYLTRYTLLSWWLNVMGMITISRVMRAVT